MTNQEKSEKYATMCYQYGLTAILVILEQYDRDGNYSETQIIIDGIQSMEVVKILGLQINNETRFTMLLRLITGRDGIEVFNYLEKHIQVIKDYVK